MKLSPGARLKSPASSCEVIVVAMPKVEGALTCGGAPMSPDSTAGSGEVDPATAVLLGKRYVDTAGSGLELLCVVGGAGPLEFDDSPLVQQVAKSLPASD